VAVEDFRRREIMCIRWFAQSRITKPKIFFDLIICHCRIVWLFSDRFPNVSATACNSAHDKSETTRSGDPKITLALLYQCCSGLSIEMWSWDCESHSRRGSALTLCNGILATNEYSRVLFFVDFIRLPVASMCSSSGLLVVFITRFVVCSCSFEKYDTRGGFSYSC